MRDLEEDYIKWCDDRTTGVSNYKEQLLYLVAVVKLCIKHETKQFIHSNFSVVRVYDPGLALEEYSSRVMHELYKKLPDVVLCKRYGITLKE